MKRLPPLVSKPSYSLRMENEIMRILIELIYKPLIDELSLHKAEVVNSVDAIAEAVRTGKIFYANGEFKGDFNAKISKELKALGAVFNKTKKAWVLNAALPPHISIAVANAAARYDGMRTGALSALQSIQPSIIDSISRIPDTMIETIREIKTDFDETVKTIAIPAQLTDEQHGIIAAEWGYNMDLHIKDWTDSAVKDLREKIKTHALEGKRAESIVEEIQRSYKVSRQKATFLAKQETNLLVSKYRQVRYKAAGITKYTWSTSGDERVRDDHKDLDGLVFSWDEPPVVNLKTGKKAHPSEDFGCRCVAVPLIE